MEIDFAFEGENMNPFIDPPLETHLGLNRSG